MQRKPKCSICKKAEGVYRAGETLKRFCGAECGAILALQIKAKRDAAKVKETKKRYAKEKEAFRDNDLPYQHNLTKVSFNRMRVLQCKLRFYERNQEPECISCGRKKMDWCCGHFKTVGQAGQLRYDPKNTHLQCNKNCNMSLSGNITGTKTSRGYIKGLIEVYGQTIGAALYQYCNEKQYQKHKWTCDEVKNIRIEANKEIRRIEAILNTYEATQ